MSAIVDYCIVTTGCELRDRKAADEIREVINGRRDKHPVGFKATHPDHQAIALGGHALNVQGGSATGILRNFAAVRDYFNTFSAKHGKQPYVSIWNELVWEVINKRGMSWREFSVLCGLYSWIGSRRKAYVTRSVIQSRALGYKSRGVMNAELANRTDGAKELTLAQVNYTLDRLHERQFFARVRRDPWHTYYSVSLSQDQLEKALLDSVSYKAGFHQRRVTRTSAFMLQVKAARTVANVNTANVNTPPAGCPRGVHADSTGVFTPLSTESSLSVHITKPLLPNPSTKPFPLNPSQETLPTSSAVSTAVDEGKEPEAPKPTPEANLPPAVKATWDALKQELGIPTTKP